MQNHKKLINLFILIIIFINISSFTNQNYCNSYDVCFSPVQNCADLIVDQINKANATVLVQAYGFTSKKIILALINAKKRGVYVAVILDRSNFHKNKKPTLDLLNEHKIVIYQDNVIGIAHNKIIIIDQMKVITGSFNFTDAAEKRNSENVIILSDDKIAKLYLINWEQRKQASKHYDK